MLDTAMPYFARAVQLKPDYGEAYYNLALAYVGTHELEKAYQMYERLVKIDPEAAKILLTRLRDNRSKK